MSKSGTLTYQMMYELSDIGFSTCVGIGGDPVIGTTHIDALAAFQDDPETDAIVMIGEIGGDAEERAADFIKANVTKPVVGYIAGFTAPPGKTMGHAGAIISGSSGHRGGEEGRARGGRREGRQDAERDRAADAPDHELTLGSRARSRASGASASSRSLPGAGRLVGMAPMPVTPDEPAAGLGRPRTPRPHSARPRPHTLPPASRCPGHPRRSADGAARRRGEGLVNRETVRLPDQRGRGGDRPGRRAPLPLAAAVAAAWAAVVSYAPVAMVLALAQLAGGGGPPSDAARLGLAGWLLGHGVPLETAPGPLALTPLGAVARSWHGG